MISFVILELLVIVASLGLLPVMNLVVCVKFVYILAKGAVEIVVYIRFFFFFCENDVILLYIFDVTAHRTVVVKTYDIDTIVFSIFYA